MQTTLLNPKTLSRLMKLQTRLIPTFYIIQTLPVKSPLIVSPSTAVHIPVRNVSSTSPTLSQSVIQETVSVLPGVTDHHNGITVDLNDLALETQTAEFQAMLTASLSAWKKEGKGAVWLKVPVHFNRLIHVATDLGFHFHHAEGTQAMLKIWLPEERSDSTPQFATHQVGVSGVVVREDTRELLVVQDKNRRRTLWKFPGGLADLGEDIASTAVREVWEETGVETEFRSILAFRQQHTQPGAFGRSDLYFLCRLRPLTYELRPCSEEIKACCWMTVEQLRREVDKSSITVRITDLVLRGLEEGFDAVDIVPEEHQSIHKGLKFNMFFRPLPDMRT